MLVAKGRAGTAEVKFEVLTDEPGVELVVCAFAMYAGFAANVGVVHAILLAFLTVVVVQVVYVSGSSQLVPTLKNSKESSTQF